VPARPTGRGDVEEEEPVIDWGREVCGDLAVAESREWLCANGIGGFASGTVAGTLTRRYHGLLVAALAPPLGRTLLAARVAERVEAHGRAWELGTSRWADGTVAPAGHVLLERFHLEGTVPCWTYALGELRLERRVWMEQGANTTYVQYRLVRGGETLRLSVDAFVNHRDYHATTRGHGWTMAVAAEAGTLRVTAFPGARPLRVGAAGAAVRPAHVWHHRHGLPRERERGLDAEDDHLHAGTLGLDLAPGQARTVVISCEATADPDGEAALARRRAHEAELLRRWRATGPAARRAPAWIDQLVLAADQFVCRRPLADDPDGVSVIAGYPWFGDWGRDTMIALPGLTLATGRPELAARILRTFARFLDRGMLPNRFPDAGEAPEYNTVDATLWYVEAVRATVAATGDLALAKDLFPALEDIVRWHRQGTRYGIGVDPADGLLRAGEPGVQLTWMDAKVGDWVVTPRSGKAVEVNALWHNALAAMAELAGRLDLPAAGWREEAARVAAAFERFWDEPAGRLRDVIDGPGGDDASLRPNQLLAASLPASPLEPGRRRRVVEACARALLTPVGLRSLAPGAPGYRPRYEGGPRERDAAYHQGTVWAWLLGPFVEAHLRAWGDPAAARSFLEPLRHHLAEAGAGTVSEIFDAEPPYRPRGCPAQAWSVAEILRAWVLTESSAPGESRR
jgi:predicted glycogen debranching enzyme